MIRRTVLPCTAALALIAAGMVAVSGPALAADTATINGATTYQTMAGFGASEAFGQAGTVMNAPAAAQQQANGVVTQSGESVSIGNESYNASIPAGNSTQLGFQGTWTSSDAAPTAFTLNGTACSL